ncbi:MAG: hypothetical protein V7K92_25545 [Nostoc sp.]
MISWNHQTSTFPRGNLWAVCFWLRVIIESLKKYPHYERSLFGLQALGKHEAAQVVKAELETAWKGDDKET